MTRAVTAMSGTEAGGAAAAIDPRLKPAAHEFEASLMKEFLAPLDHDALTGDGDDGSDGGSEGALMSFGSEALAKVISERGGFGIATKIIEHFEAGESRAAPVEGKSAFKSCRKAPMMRMGGSRG